LVIPLLVHADRPGSCPARILIARPPPRPWPVRGRSR